MKRKSTSRRDFLKNTALGAAGLSLAGPAIGGKRGTDEPPNSGAPSAFRLNYAPPLGMFEGHAGKNPIEQIRFMADQGFRAVFDNGLMGRPVAEQEAIARETAQLGLDIGPFVAYADFGVKSFVTRANGVRELLSPKLKTAVETAKRTG
jgi:hydroxypyruvate isomerase